MKKKEGQHIISCTLLAVFLVILCSLDGGAYQSFNMEADCLECHGYEPLSLFYNCSYCHTIYTGGPSSDGHQAHLRTGIPEGCVTCHIDIGDDPPLANCVKCHVKAGLIEHHNYVAEATTLSKRDTGLCWMCHMSDTPLPEGTKPPAFAEVCLNPCDGSEELLSLGSYTTSLDNDGDLLVDSADPDCVTCFASFVRKVGTPPVDYPSLQEAYDFAGESDILCGNDIAFYEDVSIDTVKNVYFEGGYDCHFGTIVGKSTVIGNLTVSSGTLTIKSGVLELKTTEEVCADCVDNDSDGLVDCEDTECEGNPLCVAAVPTDHTVDLGGYMHMPGMEDPYNTGCTICHGGDLQGDYGPSCVGCHTADHTVDLGGYMHMPGREDPYNTGCTTCHGGDLDGSAIAPSCIECHTADHTEDVGAGIMHKPGKDDPYSYGCTTCHGSDLDGSAIAPSCGACHGSHTTHISRVYGPQLACTDCHGSNAPPTFADGQNLTGTVVCDNCHSPGGTYDGVNDSLIGAKNNWENGVYSGIILVAGKEKWCAGCHDESPSRINGVDAPNVIGNEDGAYNYGTGYGYYETGHGLPAGRYYPSSGNTMFGAGLNCDGCHDFSMSHIDGLSRTYAQPGTSEGYQEGYRLISIGGDVPLEIPRSNLCPWEPGYENQLEVEPDDFRLCFSCHDSEAFISTGSISTNFRNDSSGVNAHYCHLSEYQNCGPGPMWASDWEGGYDSRVTCVSCHNVHGSKQLSMVRDGELISREPGLEVAYYNEGVSYLCGGPNEHPPTPFGVTLPDSTGTVWNANVGNLCSGCHGSCGFDQLYLRTPFASLTPFISGAFGRSESSMLVVLFSEGVYSDPGISGDVVPEDLVFVDIDDGRTIAGVTHNAGDSFAQVTLSTELDGSDDIGTDTLAAATGLSIYNSGNIAMDITPVTIMEDTDPPSVSGQNPSHGVTGVAVDSDITFTLSDIGGGVDWSTFSIQLTGDLGYSGTYTDLDTSIVTKTGSPASYDVTVNPDTDFANSEIITVMVNVDDLVGNSLVPLVWSFTGESGGAPETIVIHPSGLASSTVPWNIIGGVWSDVLDSNDGDTTYVHYCCSSPGQIFYVDMDNPEGLESVTIQSISFFVYARYVNGPWPNPSPIVENLDIGYKTGTNTTWKGNTATDTSGNYNLISSISYTNDSDGGTLDLTDINNLQIAVKRNGSGSQQLRVTEVYVEVTY